MKPLNCDCLKLLNEIDDNSVDMILCDLPYGCTQNQWDIRLPFDILWEHYEIIIKQMVRLYYLDHSHLQAHWSQVI